MQKNPSNGQYYIWIFVNGSEVVAQGYTVKITLRGDRMRIENVSRVYSVDLDTEDLWQPEKTEEAVEPLSLNAAQLRASSTQDGVTEDKVKEGFEYLLLATYEVVKN